MGASGGLTLNSSEAWAALSNSLSTSSSVSRVSCERPDSSLCIKRGNERQAVSSPIESEGANLNSETLLVLWQVSRDLLLFSCQLQSLFLAHTPAMECRIENLGFTAAHQSPSRGW